MKRLLLIMILTFSFQSWTKADDISDFQIEGLSIGDSLLDYFSRDEIEKVPKTWYPSKEYYMINLPNNNNHTFETVGVSLKNNDKKYLLKSIGGQIFYKTNIKDCYTKKNEIVNELSEIFINITEKENAGKVILNSDKTGKSFAETVNFLFDNGALISVQCKDWSEALDYWDRLKVSLVSKEYYEFTQFRAFKNN
mgnify:FL=1